MREWSDPPLPPLLLGFSVVVLGMVVGGAGGDTVVRAIVDLACGPAGCNRAVLGVGGWAVPGLPVVAGLAIYFLAPIRDFWWWAMLACGTAAMAALIVALPLDGLALREMGKAHPELWDTAGFGAVAALVPLLLAGFAAKGLSPEDGESREWLMLGVCGLEVVAVGATVVWSLASG